jgi:hypothetical protein
MLVVPLVRASGKLSTGRPNCDCQVRGRSAIGFTVRPHLSRMRVTEPSTFADHDRPPRRALLLTILAYLWALPTTFIGLLFVPAALVGGGWQVVDGVLELHGGIVRLFLERGTFLPGGASAMTLGHVVLGRDLAALQRTRAHERIHVRQVERWGPFFLPAYVIASLIALIQRKDAYRENCFEREAFEGAP